MRVAICFSCDETYMPLCKGLTLSLQNTLRYSPSTMDISLHFIDIGCSVPSLRWLQGNDVSLHAFSRKDYRLLPDQEHLPSYADAQICRPFLPKLVPGYDTYVWLDCDMWLQTADVVAAAVQAVAEHPDKLALCPEIHYGYMLRRRQGNSIETQEKIYRALYKDASLARQYAQLPMFNAGFFAMKQSNPLWQAWSEELALLYEGDHSKNPSVLHFAQKYGINRILHKRQAFIPLDPLFNYVCADASVALNERNKVTVGYPPHSLVKGVHLQHFSYYGATYLAKKLLYNQGDYLTDDERSALTKRLRKHQLTEIPSST